MLIQPGLAFVIMIRRPLYSLQNSPIKDWQFICLEGCTLLCFNYCCTLLLSKSLKGIYVGHAMVLYQKLNKKLAIIIIT